MYLSIPAAIMGACFLLFKQLGRPVALIVFTIGVLLLLANNYRPVHLVDAPIMAVKDHKYYQSIKVSAMGRNIWLGTTERVTTGCRVSGRIEWRDRRPEIVPGNLWYRMRGGHHSAQLKLSNISCNERTSRPVRAPLVYAFFSGDLSFVDYDVVRLLVDSNLIHLFVVSGLHLGLIALFINRLRQLRSPRVIVLLVVLIGGYYLTLVNFGPSALRVVSFVIVCFYCKLLRLNYTLLHCLLLTMMLSLVLAPSMFWSLGYWMSYGAVALIFGLIQGSRGSRLYTAVIVQYLLTFFSYAMLFGRIGLMSSLGANAFLVSLWPLVYPLVLVASLMNLEVLASEIERFLNALLTLFSSANRTLYGSNSYWLRPALLALLFCWPMLSMRIRIIAILFAVQMYLPRVEAPLVDIIDVGQGSALLVSSEGRGILIDLGIGDEQYAIYSKTIAPLLRYRGVSDVRYLTSHSDADHSGGKYFAENDLMARAAIARRPEHCVRGQQWQLINTQVSVLWPPQRQPRAYNNSYSCVFEIQLETRKILVMGDGAVSDELAMLESFAVGTYDAIVIGHHGSATSSSWALLNHIETPLALISSGARSRFGHPHDKTLQKLSHFAMKVLVTYEVGTITLHNDNDKLVASPACENLLVNNNWC